MSLFICPACGGADLHEARYVHMDTGEVLEPASVLFQAWCCDCSDTVKPIEREGGEA